MSWSFGVEAHERQHVKAALEAKAAQTKATRQHAVSESTEQIDVAVTAALGILASGAVGDEKKRYSVFLSGHANHDHHHLANNANDAITVTVEQVYQT